jgi:sorbitol-specific phosphotransferase system component IIA
MDILKELKQLNKKGLITFNSNSIEQISNYCYINSWLKKSLKDAIQRINSIGLDKFGHKMTINFHIINEDNRELKHCYIEFKKIFIDKKETIVINDCNFIKDFEVIKPKPEKYFRNFINVGAI